MKVFNTSYKPKLIDGKAISQKIKRNLKNDIEKMYYKPKLAVIQVGNRADSNKYILNKQKSCEEVGIDFIHKRLLHTCDNRDLLYEINYFNNIRNCNVDGVIVQLPLPEHLDEKYIIEHLDPSKDVDGLTSENMGLLALRGQEPNFYPCTAKGCVTLLKEYNVPIEGQNVVIIGRSNIVGTPLSLMLQKENATVTVVHTKTRNIKEYTRKADILIVACGKPKMVDSDWVKEGVVILDVGINVENGKIVGDVDFEDVIDVCSLITPVPGGVGPMTVATLLENTTQSAIKKEKHILSKIQKKNL